MKKIFLSGLMIAFIFSSCRFIEGQQMKGDGNVTTAQRNVTGFTGAETHGSIDIEVAQGDYKVIVECDKNLIPYIVTEVIDGRLNVHFSDDFHGYNYTSAKVYVTAPALTAFETHGSGNIEGKGKISDSGAMTLNISGSGNIKLELHSPDIQAEIHGSGNITVDGETKNFSTGVYGSGDTFASGLKAENVKASIHGSGNADVSASVKLDVEIFGSGDVNYKGTPQVNTESHGSGSVNAVN